MTFHGFDVDRLTTFAGSLDTLAGHATGLHQQLSTVLNTVQANLPPGQHASNHADLQQLVGASSGSGDTGFWGALPGIIGRSTMMPGRLTGELGSMQGEIKRRITQLKGVVAFEGAGYPVDDASVFLDEGAPDGAKVDNALKALQGLQNADFGANGDSDDLAKVDDLLSGLNSAELDAVVSKADPATLAHYNELLNDHDDSLWNPLDHNGVSTTTRDALLQSLLSRLGPENFAKFTTAFPSVQPIYTNTMAYKDGQNPQNQVNGVGLHWGTPTDPLFNGPVSVNDIHQRGIGDCWYFASLDALAQRNPQFIQDGIKQNPNGTVSVRIWDKNGDFHWVTVTPDILMDGNGNPVSATGNGDTWPAYYEKAFALAYGGKDGYGGIEGDWPSNAMPYISGHSGHDVETGGFLGMGKHDDMDIGDLKKLYDSGKGITVSAPDGDEKNLPKDAPQGYVTNHAYSVSGFTDDGKIVLSNPWDPGNLKLTVTQEQFKKYFTNPQEFDIP
ncbi:MAG: peptidase C2 calpain [Streptomyces sp.]|nr:peptidase C2 calpain [Streptomyces sp.]